VFVKGVVMNPRPRTKQVADEVWERFAQEDPFTYILTGSRNFDQKTFWQSGERAVQLEFIPLIRTQAIRTRIGLELGCGVGRLLFPLSSQFQKMVGVDIAASMVQRACAFAANSGIQNVELSLITGPEDLLRKAAKYAGKIDFLYSLLVFQHIADFAAIEEYLHGISVLLEENGIAYLQFDTRGQGYFYHIKTWLPDFLLPRYWRRGIRRVRRTPEEIENCLTRARLEIVGELHPHSAHHRYILRKAHGQGITA
jgi:SAM-dependent methyltransferase